MRRTKEQAAETNRQILEAAENLFLEKGYDNVSLEEVAVLAGVTRGAIHWHFKNKQGLLLALRNIAYEPFHQLADETPGTGPASLAKLGNLISETFELLQNDPRQQGLCRVMLRLELAFGGKDEPITASFPGEIQNAFVRIFEAIDRETGLAPPWTPVKAAATLSATIGGLIMEWSLGRGTLEISRDGSLCIRTFLSNLTK